MGSPWFCRAVSESLLWDIHKKYICQGMHQNTRQMNITTSHSMLTKSPSIQPMEWKREE
jgi:hypothetical protein